MKRILFFLMTLALIAISCNKSDDNPEIAFPIHLTNAKIQFQLDKGTLFINSIEQNLNDYKNEIESILKSEIGSMKDLREFDSITFINDSLIELYRYYDFSLLGKYKVNNGKVTIVQVMNKAQGIWTGANELSHWNYADISLKKITLYRTAKKYKGYLYDQSGNISDANMDGVINEKDNTSATSYIEGQFSIDKIIEKHYEDVNGKWDITKADTVLTIPYKLIIE